jgi:hypothetical protein
MAAHKSKLGRLHELVAEAYTSAIEVDIEEKIFNPAMLAAAAKFLKDNEISAEVKSDDDLSALRNKLADAAKERRNAGAAILRLASGDDMEP